MSKTLKLQILNKSQAESIYRAMCELNNIGGRILVNIGSKCVNEDPTGLI